MTARDLFFPPSDKLERARQLMGKVDYDTVRGVYRPKPAATQAAWDALAAAARRQQAAQTNP